MSKFFTCAVLLLLLLTSCRHTEKTEKEEAAYWHEMVIDSSYRLLYNDGDTARAIPYFNEALSQSNLTSIYPLAARYRLLANYHYFFTGDNIAIAQMIDSALALYHPEELQHQYPRAYVSLLLFGGQIAYRLSQYSKANEYYFRAKKLADAYLDPCEKTSFNYNIAMVLYRQQNFLESLHYFQAAYRLQATCSPQTTSIVLQQQEIQSNIGLCYMHLKRFDSALVHFDKSLQIADRYCDSLGAGTIDKIYGVIYGHKGQVALQQNRLDEAEQLALKSIALNDRKGYEEEHAMNVKLQLADVYNRKKMFGDMSRILYSLRDTIRSTNPTTQLEWDRLMATYHEQTKKSDSALYFSKHHFRRKDSIDKVQMQLTAADVDRQLKAKEQDLQIAMLKKDQQITLISLWVTIIISVMTLAIIYLVYHHYRRSKKSLATQMLLNDEIRKQKEAREEEVRKRHKLITEAVICAQESERSLIGLELHDNINQVLTTVKLHNEMILEGIGDPKLLLPRTLKYLQECINEIRSLSKRLSAPTLGKISLEESVKDLIDSINLTSKVKITRQIDGLENQMLPQEMHIGVYRILQEQLHNVLKHAEASEVVVQLQHNEGKVCLIVTDNGKGFSLQSRKAGIGLINMQTRAENLNGTFELVSNPGSGCKLKVELPCMQ